MTLKFDFHAHIFTEEIADKLIGKMEAIYGVKRRHHATVDGVLASASNGGIDRVVILSIANRPEHIVYNDWYAKLGREYETIIPFGSIHIENDPSELDRFPQLGLKGFKIQPNAQRFYPDDPRMFPIYERAAALGLIAVFHAGDEEGGVKGVFSQPKHYLNIIKGFPELTIVLAHFGGYQAWGDVGPLLGFDNVYFDTAYLPGKIDDALFVELAGRIGYDRILFGTDFPFRDHGVEREYVERLFGEGATRFLSENPARLLGLDGKRS